MHNDALDVIKYVGDNDVLVHKSVVEDFNSKTQLIVDESQEAILYKEGQALDLFGPGRHTLTTDNLPLLRKLIGALFGGKTPYPCTVYFINKVSVLDVLWGTDTPIPLEDPKYHLLINVRANGTMVLQIEDSRKFVVGVCGQLSDFTVDGIKRGIKGAVMMIIKNSIAKAIAQEGISILEISANLDKLSAIALEKLNEEIKYFGLKLVKFYVNSVSAGPEELQELKDAKSKAAAAVIEAEAKAKSRQIQGYDYRTERQFDVLETAAGNEGGAAGAMIGAGMGLGVGFGLGGTVGGMARDSMQQSQPQQTPAGTCPNCGQPLAPGAKFCGNCGQKVEKPAAKFCPECGAKIEGGAKFCPECGHKLG